MLERGAPGGNPRHGGHEHEPETLLLVPDMALRLEDPELCANGRVGLGDPSRFRRTSPAVARPSR